MIDKTNYTMRIGKMFDCFRKSFKNKKKILNSQNLSFFYLQSFSYVIISFFSSYPCLAQNSSVVRLVTYNPRVILIDGIKGNPRRNFASGVIVNLSDNQTVVITALHTLNDDKEGFFVEFDIEFDEIQRSEQRFRKPEQVLKGPTSDFAVLLFSDGDSQLIKKYSVSQGFSAQLNVNDSLQVIGYPYDTPEEVNVDSSVTQLNSTLCNLQETYEGDSDINYRQLATDGNLQFQGGMSGGGVFDSQNRWVGIHLGTCDAHERSSAGTTGFAVSAETVFRLIQAQFPQINVVVNAPTDSLSDFLETEVSPDLKQPIGGQW